jgi:hypothetical protein
VSDAAGLPASTTTLTGTAQAWALVDVRPRSAETLRELLGQPEEGVVLDDAAVLLGDDGATIQRQQIVRDAWRGPGGR